ncbi:MAG: SixA phosphatase family protein, partial [Acidimicrobiales bacterium]
RPVTASGQPEELHLWLLRHAKAMPEPPSGGDDHERRLAPSGRRDAAALGLRLRAGDLVPGDAAGPELALASSAARTAETAGEVAAALGIAVDLRHRLYYGSPDDVLAELRTLDDGVRAVMVVGHNPATHELACELLAREDRSGRAQLRSFPTCAVARFATGVARWRDLSYGSAVLVGFARPPYD